MNQTLLPRSARRALRKFSSVPISNNTRQCSSLPTELCRSPSLGLRRWYHSSMFIPRQSPYAVLGVPGNSSFDQVKRAFVQLALQTHPDHQGGSTEEFMRIRLAFESIQHEKSGRHGPSGWTAQELKEWWEEETGEFLSFSMCDDTRKEVIRAFHTMQPSGRDSGGHWEMARQLAERDELMKKHGKQPAKGDRPVAQLESSSVINRRRRKR